jgi:hypothetical protein
MAPSDRYYGPGERSLVVAYQEGYSSAKLSDGGQHEPCVYQSGTAEYDAWWNGFLRFDEGLRGVSHNSRISNRLKQSGPNEPYGE